MRSLEGSLIREKKNVNNGAHYLSLHSNAAQDIAVNSSMLHQSLLFASSTCRSASGDDSNQLCADSWGGALLVSADNSDTGNVGGSDTNSIGREQLSEDERELAEALVAVVQQNSKNSLIHDFGHIAKVVSEGRVVEASNDLLDNSIRIYQEHEELRDTTDLVPNLLPPLLPIKRVQDAIWYPVKNNIQYQQSKDINHTLGPIQSDECDIDVNLPPSLALNKQQQNRKTLPHKKRISRKLKKNVTQQVNDAQQVVEIIQDNVNNQIMAVHDNSMAPNQVVDGMTHAERAVFICQLCGDYYGEDQLQFYHHLKQHYEPNTQTMIMQNAIESIEQTHEEQINMDKIADNMIDEGNQLPESLVELSLEGGVNEKATMYTAHHKLPNYISVDKSLFITNDKDSIFQPDDKIMYEQSQKQHSYIAVEKQYNCHHCNRVFKRHRQYELHLREVHAKMDEMSEFSEPEDLMEGINVVVEPENEEFLHDDLSSEHSNTVLIQTTMGGHDQYILPHLTIDNGHAHQAHLNSKHWHIKEILGIETEKSVDTNIISDELSADGAESVDGIVDSDIVDGRVVCSFCGTVLSSKKDYSSHAEHCHIQLKEEVLQRMMIGDIDMDDSEVADEEIVDNNLVVDENREEELPIKVENQAVKSESNYKSAKKEPVKGKAVYKCKDCDREFKHRNSLIYHQQSHGGTRPYLCEICNKRFFSASALKVHTRLHSGVKPFKCEECGRLFRQWGDLKYHCISLHSNMKVHQCEYCGKDFARKYSLIVHRRIHTGEKNYKCEFCDKKFRASSYLQNHRRIHTGEKPHVCEVCSKPFRMKGDMRRHMNSHNKEKSKPVAIKNETV